MQQMCCTLMLVNTLTNFNWWNIIVKGYQYDNILKTRCSYKTVNTSNFSKY